MKRLLTPTIAPVLSAALATMAADSVAADKEWQLMSRHGACADFSSLKRVFPDLGTVSSPEAFVAFVKQKGLKVITRDIRAPVGKMVAVEVPERELALWFASQALCSSTFKP